MYEKSRASFTRRRKKWWFKRDKKCQAPFKHKCDTEHPLQIHHILPHAYLKRVAPGVSADYPENGIVLCRASHEVIHPDVAWARKTYHKDNEVFEKLRQQRSFLLNLKKIYWVDRYDRVMTVIALVNTRKYVKKHPFPVYNHRHEKTKEPENSKD